jgi:hypothetical protein
MWRMVSESAPGRIRQPHQPSDVQLPQISKAARKHLATQIDLNPAQRQADTDAAERILPGDPRSLNIAPRQRWLDLA